MPFDDDDNEKKSKIIYRLLSSFKDFFPSLVTINRDFLALDLFN